MQRRLSPGMRHLESAKGWDIEAKLRRWYLDDQLTQEEIGRLLGKPRSTISRWMRRLGIPTREQQWALPEKSTAEVA